MKIGITSSAYFDDTNYKANMPTMKAHGYYGIDYQGMANPQSELYAVSTAEVKRRLSDMNEMAEDIGLKFHQAHGLWPVDDTSEEKRIENFDIFKKDIEFCTYLKCGYLVIHPMMPYGYGSGENPEKIYAMNVEFFGKLAKFADKSGVVICVENMPFTAIETSKTTEIKRMIGDIRSDSVKICLDTGHANIYRRERDIKSDIKLLGKDLKVLHVHDNNGYNDNHLIPYQGTIDWDGFTEGLKEIGFDGVLSLETAISSTMPMPMKESLQRELAKVASYLAERAVR